MQPFPEKAEFSLSRDPPQTQLPSLRLSWRRPSEIWQCGGGAVREKDDGCGDVESGTANAMTRADAGHAVKTATLSK